MRVIVVALLSVLLASPSAGSEGQPRTGYFKTTVTPLELLGEEGAKAVSSLFAADEGLTWQISVPRTYDPAKPAGVMVFIGFAEWGGAKRTWGPVLEERNIIWIGLIGAGDKKPLDERMTKAILTRQVLARDYNINPDRYYLFGYSGGAQVASILATFRPEVFKGVFLYGDARLWGDTLPPKIDLVRQNRFMFMAGSRDKDVRKMKRVAAAYRKAGITQTETFFVTNVDRKMPAAKYFEMAIEFLDSGITTDQGTE